MDWTLAIARQIDALKPVLAALFGMAGGSETERASSPTLPRHLHRAILRLLRPAEAAARRLVIAFACKTLPPAGIAAPHLPLAGRSVALRQSRHGRPGGVAHEGHALSPMGSPRSRNLALRLSDPLPMPFAPRRTAAMPRISVPGMSAPHPLRPAPEPDDQLDAGRLHLRLRAVSAALADLPAAARRFRRWQARAQRDTHHARRVWPLKPGRPPGYPATRARPHAVHDMLREAQWLAVEALSTPDTS